MSSKSLQTSDIDEVLSGRKRPEGMPEDWVGSATTSSLGWRWDDPDNRGNSVRIFRGDPNDLDLRHRTPFVIDVRVGRVRDVKAIRLTMMRSLPRLCELTPEIRSSAECNFLYLDIPLMPKRFG
jgi:hypothetical protein